VSVLGVAIEAHQVDKNLWITWGCTGSVIGAFSEGVEGEWLELDSGEYSSRYSLDLSRAGV
jgi:hypothetical protein